MREPFSISFGVLVENAPAEKLLILEILFSYYFRFKNITIVLVSKGTSDFKYLEIDSGL